MKCDVVVFRTESLDFPFRRGGATTSIVVLPLSETNRGRPGLPAYSCNSVVGIFETDEGVRR